MATPGPPDASVVKFLSQRYALSELAKTGLSILLVYSTHYGTTKAYNIVCVPDGFAGYFMGFVTTASPWCKFMLELMKVTENQYSTIILVVVSRLLFASLGI
jgi:hypothetical protein